MKRLQEIITHMKKYQDDTFAYMHKYRCYDEGYIVGDGVISKTITSNSIVFVAQQLSFIFVSPHIT